MLEKLLPIARLAGSAVMAVYATEQFAATLKKDTSPLTQADLSAHQVLVHHLQQLLPDCPVVSEESESSHAGRCQSRRFWLIDPLDGTKEFIAGNGEFTVNIALVEEGRSILGVVYAPAIDTLYWGGAGLGAWRCIGNVPIAIRVAEPADVSVCRVIASRSHLDVDTKVMIDRLGPVQLMQAGSSLKFCRIAEGEADMYPRLAPTCEWDTAAAQAVLEGAGGLVLDLQGRPLRYGKPEVFNPSFVAAGCMAWMPE
ncbi:3'(2'),5'-bisphosphate nucleotidase [Acidovorax sp. 56]|nr:3'(2'),5'-bisphosphate nucleotidase [Acidovorax sp. 56]